jgi:hypothetical protein
MSSKILARIASETGVPGLARVLAENLSPSDLQSLLLHVYQARSGALREADLVAAGGRALLAPSKLSARLLNQFDGVAFQVGDNSRPSSFRPCVPWG